MSPNGPLGIDDIRSTTWILVSITIHTVLWGFHPVLISVSLLCALRSLRRDCMVLSGNRGLTCGSIPQLERAVEVQKTES